jgi:hypothetical protein
VYAKQNTKTLLTTEDLGNTEKITKEYYPEMEKWLKELYVTLQGRNIIPWADLPSFSSTGAARVHIFNHATRISTSVFNINDFKKEQEAKKVSHQPAVFAAHLDQSSWQAGNVLHKYFPDETEEFLHGRVMIVNVSLRRLDALLILDECIY